VSNILQAVASSGWYIFLTVFFFGGSIFVHELGHFLAARRRGVKVERFSIGFGPAIWSRRGRDGVEYRLSWFPLGGYVLLPQLADLGPIEGESQVDVSQLPPVTYSTKVLVFVAGAAFNILFAFVLSSILWVVGASVAEEDQTTRIGMARPTIEVSPGKSVPGPAYVAGLRTGDVIVAVDGKTVTSFSEIGQLIALGGGRDEKNRPQVTITYERNGQRMPPAVVQPALAGADEMREIGIEPALKVVIAEVLAGFPAEQAGAKSGDVLLAIDGKPVNYSSYVEEHIREAGGRPVTLSVVRDGQPLQLNVTPRVVVDPKSKAQTYRLGVALRGSFTIKTVHIAPWKQLSRLVVFTWRNVQSLINPSTDVGLSKMSGAVGIARIFYNAAEDGFQSVLAFTILININLAIFNLLPIPVLDGGHILFATIARLRGRSLPVTFIVTTQSVFMMLLLMMMIYVGFFDIRRWRRDRAERELPARTAPAIAPTPAAAGQPGK
jgi:regulator of sigma E protease